MNMLNALLHPTIKTRLMLVVTTFLIAAVLPLSQFPTVSANSIDDLRNQVSQIEAEIAQNESELNAIQSERQTLENKIYQFDLEISNTEKRIDATNKKIASLEIEITEAEAELARQEMILGEAIKELYKRGDITTIELLASSDSYSDFINQQEYLNRVKTSIQESASEVKALKTELETQRDEQNVLASELEGQRKILALKRTEQADILAETQGEEARYQSILAQNQTLLDQAQAQLIEAIAASQTGTVFGGTGNYPWAGISPWSFASCYPDPWGMCKRQCVSYTAWKVNEDYWAGKARFPMPHWGGIGNAYEWPRNARNAGIPTGSVPKKGAIAINPYVACTGGGFCYGHSMYVEAVLPNGNIWVSQYNAQATGVYSEAEVNPNGLTFIYFNEW
jgi:peptidoglycan hydrolase CwlO-like protein